MLALRELEAIQLRKIIVEQAYIFIIQVLRCKTLKQVYNFRELRRPQRAAADIFRQGRRRTKLTCALPPTLWSRRRALACICHIARDDLRHYITRSFRSVTAIYGTAFHESNDARVVSWAKRASMLLNPALPSTTNDISSMEDLMDLEIPPSWGNGPYKSDEERHRIVRAPPLPRLGKFRRYLDDFKGLERRWDWPSLNRGENHPSSEAESFFRICSEFGSVKEFSMWCKRRWE